MSTLLTNRYPCGTCASLGYILCNRFEPCTYCKGSGKRVVDEGDNSIGHWVKYASCSFCEGAGGRKVFDKKKCPRCNGAGFVTY